MEDLIFNDYTKFFAIGIGYNLFFHHYRKKRDFMGMVWSGFFASILWWWPLIDDGLDLMIGLREPLDPTTNSTFVGFGCVMWYVGWSFIFGVISPYTYALMGVTYRKFGDVLEYLIKNID